MPSFTILSWNTWGRPDFVGYHVPFSSVLSVLNEFSPDIVCLQEVINFAPGSRVVSGVYGVAASDQGSPWNDNLILSKHPITAREEFVFPEMKGRLVEGAMRAEISISGVTLGVYNCHLQITGVGIRERLEQLRFILEDAKRFIGPVIVCGDMNTTVPIQGFRRKLVQVVHREPESSMYVDGVYCADDERGVFLEVAESFGFKEALDVSLPTWRAHKTPFEVFGLKLDWFLTKGVTVKKVSLGKYVSDHRPIFAECEI